MRLTMEKTIQVKVCNYCKKELSFPARGYHSGTEDEVNLCAGWTPVGKESCADSWWREQLEKAGDKSFA